MRHILSVEVLNTPGVLARVASLFSARGYNIDSLAVGETEAPDRSRMTIVVSGENVVIEQIRKQLLKLIDTIKVVDLTHESVVERDLALVKLRVPPSRRTELAQLAELFRARVVDVSPRNMIVEISGREDKITAFLDLLAGMGREAPNTADRAAELAVARAVGRLTARNAGATSDDDEDDAPSAPSNGNGGGKRGKNRAEEAFGIIEMVRTGRVAIKRG